MVPGIYLIHELPSEAQELTCTESTTGSIYGPYPKLVFHNNYIPSCSSCKLPPYWSLYTCDACEEFFVNDFVHPGFCYREPLCWDCLLPDSYCHHCMDGWNEMMTNVKSTIRPPRLKKPKPVPFDPNFDVFKPLDFG